MAISGDKNIGIGSIVNSEHSRASMGYCYQWLQYEAEIDV